MNCPGLLQNPLEWFAAYAQGDMAFVPQNTFFVVLSQDDIDSFSPEMINEGENRVINFEDREKIDISDFPE